jgi:hypothetical protein
MLAYVSLNLGVDSESITNSFEPNLPPQILANHNGTVLPMSVADSVVGTIVTQNRLSQTTVVLDIRRCGSQDQEVHDA